MGSILPTTLRNISYMANYADVYFIFSALYFLKNKTCASMLDSFVQFEEILLYQLVEGYST